MAVYTNNQIVAAYVKNNFSKTNAAIELKTSLQNLIKTIKNRPDLQEMITTAEEMRIDIAEEKLQQMISFGDFRAVKFFLERKGIKKGYGAKLELVRDDNDRKFSIAKMVDGQKVIELK